MWDRGFKGEIRAVCVNSLVHNEMKWDRVGAIMAGLFFGLNHIMKSMVLKGIAFLSMDSQWGFGPLEKIVKICDS